MTSKSRAHSARLPGPEVLAYWVLSFGSHLYSFYQLHRFSKGQNTSACLLFRPAHLWVLNLSNLYSVALWAFFFLDSTPPHLLWSSRPLFTICTDLFTWLFSNGQPCISENEAGLQREFQMENGHLKGFKRVCFFWINIISVVSLVNDKNLICWSK